MSRLGLGLGLNLPIPIFLRGNGQPQFPSRFILKADAYDASNFSLVTGNNISQWDDLSSSSNDLTQPTSLNQPLLIEQDIVTQYTASNQPTVADVAGETVVRFDGSDKELEGLTPVAGNFTLIFSCNAIPTQNQLFLSRNTGTSSNLYGDGNKIVIQTDQGPQYGVNFLSPNPSGEIKLTLNGSIFSVEVDNVLQGTQDIGSNTFSGIGKFGHDSNSFNVEYKYIKLWYSDDSSGAPNLTLDFSDTSKMRTSANEVPLLGETVAKVYADEHNPRYNVVRGDSSNDFMLGIPPQAGDFALVFKKKANTLGTVKTLYSSSTTSAEVRVNASNQIEVVSDVGTVFTYSTSSVISEQQVNILQLNGTNLELYETQVVNESKDVTGETFTIDWLSFSSSASDSDWQELNLWPRFLTQEEIDYFYYLRDQETGDILLPPLLPE